MTILNVDFYRDGGTTVIDTDLGTFIIDGRIDSTTPNQLYYNDFNNLIKENVSNIKKQIRSGLKKYTSTYYSSNTIQNVIGKLK